MTSLSTLLTRSLHLAKHARKTERSVHTSCRALAKPALRSKGYGPHPKTYEAEEYDTRIRANQECVMHMNRAIARVEPERHRSEYANWSYDAEIFAFQQRLGENFEEKTLREALQDPSYSRKQLERQKDVGLASESSTLRDNTDLAKLGLDIVENLVKGYLRTHFTNLPEEGCDDVCAYLTSPLVSAHIARNIGIGDLVLCDKVKPVDRILTNALHAIVGALALSADEQRAQGFVLDIIVTQLAEKDPFELINAEITSFDLLNKIFKSHLDATLEPRIIRATGSTTMLSLFNVGIYSDKDPDGLPEKTFVGSGFGETLDIAVEMAAKDALRSFFGLQRGVRLTFGRDARKLTIDFEKRNWSIAALAS